MKHTIAFFLLFTALFLATCHKFDDPSVNYTYRIPSAGNELEVSSLTDEGMDSSLIIEMTDKIIQEEFKRIDGLLILKNNKLVYEEYFHGYTESVPHNIYSATKSITSVLTGIAIDKGLISSVDALILPLLHEYTSYANPDPRKSEITIRHLLNMSSGLDCDDWYANTETNMNQSNDWVKFTLDLPQVHDPGTNGLYCTGGVEHWAGLLKIKVECAWINLQIRIFSNHWELQTINGKLPVMAEFQAEAENFSSGQEIWPGSD